MIMYTGQVNNAFVCALNKLIKVLVRKQICESAIKPDCSCYYMDSEAAQKDKTF